jgi:hypothetical protein
VDSVPIVPILHRHTQRQTEADRGQLDTQPMRLGERDKNRNTMKSRGIDVANELVNDYNLIIYFDRQLFSIISSTQIQREKCSSMRCVALRCAEEIRPHLT